MTDMHQDRRLRLKFTEEQMQQIEQIISAGLAPVNLQLQNGEKRMNNLAEDIGDLSEKLNVNNVKTSQMFEMFETAQKGLKFLGGIGNGLKWATGIVTAIVTAYTLWKGGAK